MASPALLTRPTPSPTFDSNRQSLVSSHSAVSSSAGSYRTAPATAPSHSSSASSSVHTLGPSNRDSEPVHPIHALAGAKEVHILQVKGNTVQVEAGPVANSFLQTIGKNLLPSINTDRNAEEPLSHIGPPPPSPPASVERDDEAPMPPPKMRPSYSEPATRPIMFEEPARERQSSTASRDIRLGPLGSRGTAIAGPSRELAHRTSAETKASMSTARSTATSSSRLRRSNTSDDTITHPSETVLSEGSSSSSKRPAHASADGFLQPPPVTLHRPVRRNTIGSSTRVVRPPAVHAQYSSQPFVYHEGGSEGELASDIQLHAEQIRRERMSKRAKQQQEAEDALTRTETRTGKEEINVLVGNLIGEDHVNYVLMYNMLTGIRIGVSRCQAKIKRPLTDEDFSARHKFSFDIVGNELTPSAKYDFKFKDYAPWVFRELREDHFQLDPADYLLSLTAKYILSELGSPGKSGSFFYFSRDYRFIIKTIHHSEAKFLLKILKEYHGHVKNNPHTLLSRFYGLHRVKLPHGRKIHFVIMNNLFPPHRDIHETFDLKGSTVGREYSEEKAAINPRAVLKDLNWINREKMLELGPEKRALLTEQLRRDSEFLKRVDVMDYSLLVGIHNMQRGNRDNVRRNTLKVFSPDIPMRRKPTLLKGLSSPEAIAMRRAMRESDPKRLGKGTIRLPEEDTGDRQHFLFYQDEGGLRATDEANDVMDTIYYLGVIDILTPYTVVKKLEHFWKGMKADRHKISPVPPDEYSERFFSFMKAIMRGGGGGARFKSE